MPQIKIPKTILKQAKEKKGLYSTLNRKPITKVVENLKQLVIGLVEKSFREYARAHHAPNEMIELEWKRFKKFLERNL